VQYAESIQVASTLLNYFAQSEHFLPSAFCGLLRIFFNKVKMTAEQNTNNFNCEICDYSTPKQSILNQHIKTVHLKRQDLKCDYCDHD
jgi:hypothetical protein